MSFCPQRFVSLLSQNSIASTPRDQNILTKQGESVGVDQLEKAGVLVWDSRQKKWVIDLERLNAFLEADGTTVFDSHEIYMREAGRSGSNW